MKKAFALSLLFAFLLFLASLLLQGGFAVMGVKEKAVQRYVLEHYLSLIVSFSLKILLVYLAAGLVAGAGCYLFGLRRITSILAFNTFYWGFFAVRAIKIYPQMFVELLYNRGGILKLLQILITDYLPLWLIYLAAVLALVLLAILKRKVLAPLFFILVACFLIFRPWVSPARGEHLGDRPNILILASDSLRPSHISYNGYFRKTPNIDRLFSKGANFLHMTSSLARTFPSWTSILTSLYPPQHGIRHMFPDFDERQKRWLTLVDVLKKHGYYTGVVSDFAGDMFSRIDFGFDCVKAPYFNMKTLVKQRLLEIHYPLLGFVLSFWGRKLFPVIWEFAFNPDPYFVSYEAKKFIKKSLKLKKPFFLIAFYSCTHFPYAPPYPYYSLYTDRNYRGPHKYKKESLLEEYTAKISERDRKQIVALYDGGVKNFDDTVGDMLRFLEKSGLLSRTIVVIMSDHGENLYEDGYGMGHGDHLRGYYASSMTFGIWSPFHNFGGRIIKEIARDIDIAPTLLELAGIAKPQQFRGKSLVKAMEGREKLDLAAYEETGLWYSLKMPALRGGVRIPYPEVTELLRVEGQTHELVLKKKYRCLVINAKHRAISINGWKYIYMPGLNGVKEELLPYEAQFPGENRARIRKGLLAYMKKKLLEETAGATRLPSGYLVEPLCHPPGILLKPPLLTQLSKGSSK